VLGRGGEEEEVGGRGGVEVRLLGFAIRDKQEI
jgi:hypothetical protein